MTIYKSQTTLGKIQGKCYSKLMWRAFQIAMGIHSVKKTLNSVIDSVSKDIINILKKMSSDHKSDETSKDSNVRVVVRVRPPNEKERAQGKCNVVKVVDDFMLTFDPKDQDQFGSTKTRTSILDKKLRDMNFIFDRVFNDKATNEDVFEYTTKPVIESVLEGFNCSVFAYGATSAGKTHTMLGSPNKPGVIFLTMMELYKKLMAIDNDFDTDISVSYLEVRNQIKFI